jgi:methylated-DNA-[protein]-cysteine S-methyltransferase
MFSTVKRSATGSAPFRGGDLDAATHQRTRITAFPTRLDWMALAWRDDVLQGLVFGHARRRHAEVALVRSLRLPPQFFYQLDEGQSECAPGWVADLIAKLRQFADGEPVEFFDVPLALDRLSPFARRVVEACRRIPWGQVRTYGQLAAVCGSPGAARAVGSVMAKNRFPLIVPCHRVLASGGELGGYSAPAGLKMKRRLLEMEAATPLSGAHSERTMTS